MLGFTGHRPDKLGNTWHHRQWARARSWLEGEIEAELAAVPAGKVLVLVIGYCIGFDLYGPGAAAAAIKFRRPDAPLYVVAACPFPGQADRWNEEAVSYYLRAIAYADERHDLGGYHRRDDFIAEVSRRVWHCWDGRPDGGTHYTVQAAETRGRPLRPIYREICAALGIAPRVTRTPTERT